jgi:hypothetical protein
VFSSQDSAITSGTSSSSAQAGTSSKISAATAEKTKKAKKPQKPKVVIIEKRKKTALTDALLKSSGGHILAVQAILVATIIRVGISPLWNHFKRFDNVAHKVRHFMYIYVYTYIHIFI